MIRNVNISDLAKANLYEKLDIGEKEIEDKNKLLNVKDVFKELRDKY